MKRIVLWLLLLCCTGTSWATVPSVPHSVTYSCTGGTGPFPFTFPITDPTALTVTMDGNVLAPTSYTTVPVNNNYNNGGSVTLGGGFPCTAGWPLVLARVTPVTQAIQFYDNMPIPMKTFERGLDKITEIAQEIKGAASGGTTDYQHNNLPVASEPALNFIDAGGIFTVIDDPTNTRINITVTGGGASPCGSTNDVQLNLSPTALGCDPGVLVADPTAHSVTDNIVVARQEIDVLNVSQSGELDLGVGTLGSAVGVGVVAVTAPTASAAGVRYILPGAVGTDNQVLTQVSHSGTNSTLGFATPSTGSGTVNTGTASHLTYYAASTTAVSDMGADFTFLTHTLSVGASGILDLHSAATSGLLLSGNFSTGFLMVTTSTGAVSSVATSGAKCYPFGGSGGTGCDTPSGTATGTVTSIATTTPITGGTITSTGTIACATCVTSAASLTSTYIVTGAGSQASQTPSSAATLDSSGNIAATSLLVTGVVDGKAPVTITTGSSATLGGTYKGGYTFNQEASAATAITYTLPTAAAGLQYCVSNSYNGSAATTGTLEILTSASGQYIIFNDGTLSATGGYVLSGGAAGDAACVVGVDATHWQFYSQVGTWAKH